MRRLLLRFSRLSLFLWVVTAVAPALIPHGNTLDFACSDDAWTSPHPVTQIESVHPTIGDEHCFVCHLQRVARGALAEPARALPAIGGAVAGPRLGAERPTVARTESLPARAPPVVSL
jgi:hypothetical protein